MSAPGPRQVVVDTTRLIAVLGALLGLLGVILGVLALVL